MSDLLAAGADRLRVWLGTHALPVWSGPGRRADGVFVEALDGVRDPMLSPRRLRVQPRQAYVFAQAARLGWNGPAIEIIEHALAAMDRDHRRSDGLYRTLVDADGRSLDEAAMIYDHAFILLTLAVGADIVPPDPGLEARAVALRDRLLAAVLGETGLREAGPHPWQANAQMHLLEACQAWMRAGEDAGWAALAARIVDLARDRFIDPDTGALYEFFDADWRPAPGAETRIEPGHQFEWATLLLRQGRLTGDVSLEAVARRLFAVGERGLTGSPRLALDLMDGTGPAGDGGARFWPQTEWLKASLALAEISFGVERERFLDQAAEAMKAVELYLTPDGLWRDRCDATGAFDAGPSPASSFYHLMAAVEQLDLTAAAGIIPGLARMDLS